MAGFSQKPIRPHPGKKEFKRTQVSARERITSLLIVVLLAVIGIAVWIQGRNFDPGLYSLRPDAPKSKRAVVPTPALPEPTGAVKGYEESSTPVGVTDSKRYPIEISGVKPMGDTEFYSPDTLYEKIDGRAPAYIDFHFQQLRSRSFSLPVSSGSFVDVYEYRMDSPVNAFGIFALERDPAGRPLDFAPDGYSGDMGFFFRRGNCYVQIIASDQKPETLTLATSVARQVAQIIPANDTGLEARRRLPAQGIVLGSISYIQDNAQGQAFFKNVFQADYTFEGKKISFFLMVTTSEAAANAWSAYLEFSGRYGGRAEILPDVAGAKVFQAKNFGKWKVIYQRKGEIGGVIDAEDPVVARAFLGKMLGESLR